MIVVDGAQHLPPINHDHGKPSFGGVRKWVGVAALGQVGLV
jgi:hypothetical protein